MKQFIPLHARRLFYMAFIQSRLDYCSIIWGKSCHTQTLFKLQKRAVRLILDVPARTLTHDLFLQLRILPLKVRLDSRILIMVIKAMGKSAPPFIADMFSTMSAENRIYTRLCVRNDMQIPTVRLNLTKNGLRYQGSVLYNLFNKTYDLSGISVSNFKKLFIKTFLNNF